MAATTAGAIKALLEAGDTGLAWYRDLAPQDAPLPFGTIQEAISITPVRLGDRYDPAVQKVVVEQVQVSIWQPFRGSDGKPGEKYGLPAQVFGLLDGVTLPDAPTQVDGVTVDSMVRIPQVDRRGGGDAATDGANVVQHALTVSIRRNL